MPDGLLPHRTIVSPVAYLRDRGFLMERIAGTIDEFDIIAPAYTRRGSHFHVGKARIVEVATSMGWTRWETKPS